MTLQKKINEVDHTKEPAPAHEKEQSEYNDVKNTLRSKRHGQSYEAFANPTNERKEKENSLDKRRLAVKPFIELHNITSNFIFAIVL